MMIAMTMFLVYYCLMSPLSYFGITDAMPHSSAFLMLVMSLIFIVAGGYVINDYFDVETDKVNKPDKVLINNVFTEKQSLFFYWILTFLGLTFGLLSCVIALKDKFYLLFAVMVLIACLLYSYSSTYKRKFFIGNFVVSLLVSLSVFLPYLFEVLYLTNNVSVLAESKILITNILYFVVIYTMFAFLLTLIREIVKDAEDYEGDVKIHCRTIPVVCGVNKTKTVLYLLLALLIVLLFAYLYILLEFGLFVTFTMIVSVALCSIFLAVKIYKAKGQKDFHALSIMTKVMMLIGLLSMLFLR